MTINNVTIQRVGHECDVQIHTSVDSLYAKSSSVEVEFEAEPVDPEKAIPINRKIVEIRVTLRVDGIRHGPMPQ